MLRWRGSVAWSSNASTRRMRGSQSAFRCLPSPRSWNLRSPRCAIFTGDNYIVYRYEILDTSAAVQGVGCEIQFKALLVSNRNSHPTGPLMWARLATILNSPAVSRGFGSRCNPHDRVKLFADFRIDFLHRNVLGQFVEVLLRHEIW